MFWKFVGTRSVHRALLSNHSNLKPTNNPLFDLNTLRFLYVIFSCRYNLLYFTVVKTNDFILLGTYSKYYLLLCYLWVEAILFRFWRNFYLAHCIHTHLWNIFYVQDAITADGNTGDSIDRHNTNIFNSVFKQSNLFFWIIVCFFITCLCVFSITEYVSI